ncbi:MAG: glycosyltransferase [Myxococcota bacterium]|nr:glycosyltransferase [Myxococcota bacterium]
MSRVCVVIPHSGYTEGLVQALEALTSWPVLVVDDSVSGIPVSVSALEVIRLGGGSGFAVAVNAGLQRSEQLGFERTLILNDDAVPEPDCIHALMKRMDKQPGVGAVGPLLMGPAGVESAGLSYSSRTGRVLQERRVPPHAVAVDALSGACLLLRSNERMDPRFPHGFEDVDLALRMRAGGRNVVIEPAARCWHEGGKTLNRRSRQAARFAVVGHLRLVGESRVKRLFVLVLALAQVVREIGPPGRILGVWEGYRDSVLARRAAAIASGRAGSSSIM